MRSLFLSLGLMIMVVLFGLAILPANVSAVDLIDPVCSQAGSVKPEICDDNAAGVSDENSPLFGPKGIATTVAQIFAILTAIAAVIVIIISGIRMIASSGDSNTVTASRQAIIYSVVGLAVAFAAQMIISFVLKRL